MIFLDENFFIFAISFRVRVEVRVHARAFSSGRFDSSGEVFFFDWLLNIE